MQTRRATLAQTRARVANAAEPSESGETVCCDC